MSVINGLAENAIKVQTDTVSDFFWGLQKESFKVLLLKNPSEVLLERVIMPKHKTLCSKKTRDNIDSSEIQGRKVAFSVVYEMCL